jgi:[ribosomal protein S18]-alanine N-acetyltransferase
MMAWPSELQQEVAPNVQVQLLVMFEADLDRVVAIEQAAYSHPWTLGNFKDALKAGNAAFKLMAGDSLVGYLVAMQVIDEVHLLNITVAPDFQRQGWARCLMQWLQLWSQQQGALHLWLEVRQSNERALKLYQAFGFQQVGLRKDYYPASRTAREAAVVMRMAISEGGLQSLPDEPVSAHPPR